MPPQISDDDIISEISEKYFSWITILHNVIVVIQNRIDWHWLVISECLSAFFPVPSVHQSAVKYWDNYDIGQSRSHGDLYKNRRDFEPCTFFLLFPSYHVQGRCRYLYKISIRFKGSTMMKINTWQTTKQKAVIAVILTVFILTILSKFALSLLTMLQPWWSLAPSLQPAQPASALPVSLITSLTEMQELMAIVTIRGRKMKMAGKISWQFVN